MGISSNKFTLASVILAFCIAGCAGSDIPNAKKTTGRLPTIAEVPDADETVRGDADPPVVTLELGNGLRERRLSKSEDLPSGIIVPTTNLNSVPVTAALQAVLAGTDVALSWDAKTWEGRLVSVSNLSGPLPRVVERICGAAKIFCSYKNGMMELKDKETFIVELPRIPGEKGDDATNTMAETINDLALEKVRIDKQGGNLIYVADFEGQEAIGEYLEQLRNGRPLVVVQLHIWEVSLTKENAAGINWSNFRFHKINNDWESLALAGSSAFTSATTGGISLGATLRGKVDATSVMKFLSTQGQVQTISSPQLTFVSGSKAEFRVGGKQNYVSQVGQLVSSSVAGTSNSSVGTNTVSTDTVDTGLTVDVNGSFESGVITASLQITMQNLVRIDNVTSGETEIQLPVTSDRKFSSIVRVRPGDNLVLAGMVSSRDTNNREGIPLPFGARFPTMGGDELENTELVILVKPSVVLFSDKAIRAAEKKEEIKKMAAKPLPDAVVIDKDGTKTINMLDATVSRHESMRDAAEAEKEIIEEGMAASSSSLSASLNPSTPVNGGGVAVSKRMMQKEFGRIYDETGPAPLLSDGGGL